MSGKSVAFAAMAVGTLLTLMVLGCRNTEQKTILDGIPQASKEAILKIAGNNEVTGIEVITKNGVKMYEAEWMENGKEVEVLVDENGKLVSKKAEEDEEAEESEEIAEFHVEEIELSEAPAAVQQAINGEAGTDESIEIDHLRGEEKEYFEAEVRRAEGSEIRIAVAPDGTILGREEIRKVSLDSIPEVVVKAVLEHIAKDKIQEIEEATAGEQKFYDLELVKDGKEIKLRFSALGKPLAKFIEKTSPQEDEDER
jgi:uncharacterized membrane protein YkoI